MTDNAAMTQTCMQCPLPSGACHAPSHTEYVEGECAVGGGGCGGINFHCENDQKLKHRQSSYLSLWSFDFQMVFISPMWLFDCIVKGNTLLCSECGLQWRSTDLSARVKAVDAAIEGEPCTKWTTYGPMYPQRRSCVVL